MSSIVRLQGSGNTACPGWCVGCAAMPTPPADPTAAAAPSSAAVGGTNVTVTAAPPQSSGCQCSLASFLGLDKLCGGAGGCLNNARNCLGSIFPGLEATPALTALADPANLKSSNPAVAAAAEVKGQEDAAPQKIKSLKYLSTIGCTACYPDVEKAFLAGLDDCTESVRFAAAEYLRDMADCPCKICHEKSCCTPAIRKKLQDMACGKDKKTGCWKEPSPRVRRVARLALEKCGCAPPEPPPAEAAAKQPHAAEGPKKADLPQPEAPPLPEPPPPLPAPTPAKAAEAPK